jgi:hypothetical protein
MPILYNIEPARIDLQATQGDSINMNFRVTAEVLSTGVKVYVQQYNIPALGTLIHLDSVQMQVRSKDSLLLKDWYSGVTPANILINPLANGDFDLVDSDGFLESGFFDYDVQVDDGTDIFTIMSGTFYVKKQITP